MQSKIKWICLCLTLLLLAAAAFMYIHLSKSHIASSNDFISNFFDSSTDIESSEKMISSSMSNPFWSEMDNEGKRTIIKLFSGKNRYSSLTNSNEPASNCAVRIVYHVKHSEGDNINIKFRKVPSNYYELMILAGAIPRVELFDITKGKRSSLGEWILSPMPGDGITHSLNAAYFDNYLLIWSGSRLLLFYDKLERHSPGSTFIDSTITGNNFKASFTALNRDEANLMLNAVTRMNLGDRGPGYHWNSLYPEHRLVIDDRESEMLQRVKLGTVTRRSIILPINRDAVWETIIPEDSWLDLSLGLMDKFVIDPGHVIFNVTIDDGSGEPVTKTFSIPNRLFRNETWLDRRIELSKFAGKRCRIILKSNLKDQTTNSNEGKILTIWGNPVICTSRKINEKNVILVSIDTLRPDHLGCYGYRRETSPNLDRFASTGVLFQNAVSSAPWTLPAHISMLSGVYPSEGGYVQIDVTPKLNHYMVSRISHTIPTIAAYLKDMDYTTVAFTGGAFLSSLFGFDQGFEMYQENLLESKSAEVEIRNLLNWISNNDNGKFFIFFHTYEVHAPYTRRFFKSNGSGKKDEITANYDSGIKYLDKQMGLLFESLKRRKLLDNTLIIITSDHGENFTEPFLGENEGMHGVTLYDREIKVPLIIGGAIDNKHGLKIPDQVQTVDILPTILDYLDIPIEREVRGNSLLDLFMKEGKASNRLAFSEGIYLDGRSPDSRAIRSEQYKLIKNYPSGKFKNYTQYELYDYQTDINENNNMYPGKYEIYNRLKPVLEQSIKNIKRNSDFIPQKRLRKETNHELEQQLERLGYLGRIKKKDS